MNSIRGTSFSLSVVLDGLIGSTQDATDRETSTIPSSSEEEGRSTEIPSRLGQGPLLSH